jgi:peroxiredoxin
MRTIFTVGAALAFSASLAAQAGQMAGQGQMGSMSKPMDPKSGMQAGMKKDAMQDMGMMKMPAVGDKLPDVTLAKLDGMKVTLSELHKQGPVVVVMLRGWVGYQCPYCTRQVGEFLSGDNAKMLADRHANVVFVYPGDPAMVQVKAEDFISGKTVPANMHFVTDPGLKTVEAFHLRWDAPNETAYPSTFVVDKMGVVRYAKISKSHGDRAPFADVMAAVEHTSMMK